MKLLDYINQLPIGEVVTNKRLLAVLKRKGLIFDYSFFGYLESCFIYYNEQYGDKTERWHKMLHLFTKGNAPRNYRQCADGTKFLDHNVSLNCDSDELYKTYGSDGIIEYKGNYFTMQYLSGCFSPYLVKCDKNGNYSRKRSMSLWGSII